MADKFANFEELAASEPASAFRIEFAKRGSDIALIAPHAGKIEFATSEITKAIARDNLSYYLFEGCKNKYNAELHITSSNFNEPSAIEIAHSARLVITIHGQGNPSGIYVNVGGLEMDFGERIIAALNNSHFNASRHQGSLTGADRKNICNQGQTGRGIQLEISRELRERLLFDVSEMQEFAGAIRSVIKPSLNWENRSITT